MPAVTPGSDRKTEAVNLAVEPRDGPSEAGATPATSAAASSGSPGAAARAARTLSPRALARLARRASSEIDPRRACAVKRLVHEIDADVEAGALARAIVEATADPAATFGALRLRRAPGRVGLPFEEGERFHGAFDLAALLDAALARGPLAFARGAAARLLASRPLAALARALEDALLSDYAEVVEVALSPDPSTGAPRRVRYRYLEGTPIAGASTLAVRPRPEGGARVEVLFEFQETAAFALGALHRFALARHDQAVHAIVVDAARRAGGRVVASTIPEEYARR
jgi:hypothetical protein